MSKAKIKSHTDFHQSKILSYILTPESADLWFHGHGSAWESERIYDEEPASYHSAFPQWDKPCWSLAALLNILHSKAKNIPSLSGGGYKDGKYISDWCLDYEFENGDYQKTFADNPVDACVTMIEKLHELEIL